MKAVAEPLSAHVPDCSGLPRKLDKDNIADVIEDYRKRVDEMRLGLTASQHGCQLLLGLKRPEIEIGPWPKVSWFEAANRVLSDLVILYGVRWMVLRQPYPYESYVVQLGNEQKQRFDIVDAESNGRQLVGEAFSVSKKYFPTKMAKTRRKLDKSSAPVSHKVIMFNADRKDQFTTRDHDLIDYRVVNELAGTCNPVTVKPGRRPPKLG